MGPPPNCATHTDRIPEPPHPAIAVVPRSRQLAPVTKHILLYGVVCGVLIAVLEAIEYRYLVVEHSLELYGGIVAAIFSAVGIWLGVRLSRRSPRVVQRVVRKEVVREVVVQAPPVFVRDVAALESSGLSPRELEILELMAAGLSNREIGDRIFISENTVKTHASRVFDKLGAKRRTEAVQMGRRHGLIP